MKILRFKSGDETRIGFLSKEKIIPFPSKFGNDIISIISKWDDIGLEIENHIGIEDEKLDLSNADLLAPIAVSYTHLRAHET